MPSAKHTLGEYIERLERRNTEGIYGVDDVRGVSNAKGIMPTRADMTDRTFDKFLILRPREFAFNRRTTRNGERLGLGFNESDREFIFTDDYVAFKTKEDKLIPEYLYMYFLRDEFDRYVRYNSWGSATEFFNWEEMCEVPFDPPPLPIQQKYVDIYLGLKEYASSLFEGLDDLEKLCTINIRDAQQTHDIPKAKIGSLINVVDERNVDNAPLPFLGVNKDKTFMPTVANTEELDGKGYKIIRQRRFVFSGMQTGRDKCIRIALYGSDAPALISPAYTTFEIKDGVAVLPEYFFMNFKDPEMDRYGWFISDSSVRANLDWDRFCDIEIPIPSVEAQQSIVNIFNACAERRRLADRVADMQRRICPILIKGAVEEARKER